MLGMQIDNETTIVMVQDKMDAWRAALNKLHSKYSKPVVEAPFRYQYGDSVKETTRAQIVAQMDKAISATGRALINTILACQMVSNPDVAVYAPRDCENAVAINPEQKKQKKTPYQQLMVFLLQRARDQGIRHNEDTVFSPIFINYKGRRQFVHAFEQTESMEAWIRKQKPVSESSNPTIWELFSHPKIIPQIAAELAADTTSIDLPVLNPQMTIYSFLNGIWDGSKCEFYQWQNVACNCVAKKHFSVEFETERYEAERLGVDLSLEGKEFQQELFKAIALDRKGEVGSLFAFFCTPL